MEEIAVQPKPLAVGIQFRQAGKIYTFMTTNPSLEAGQPVIVEAEGGEAFAVVVAPPHEAAEGKLPQNIRRVIRLASPEEQEREHRRREQALEHFLFCRSKIRERGLPMKLVDVQLEEDGKKVVFIFFAEQRVDFRALVKDLAGALHLRIEMRQVGARDESKYRGCLGPCGLSTCCSAHLRQFQSISISMAKHQGLAPNPAKLTGMCGKLKCCLSYEHEVYNEYRQGLPKVGATVASPRGAGKVSGHNVLKRECTVRLFSGGEIRCPCEECRVLTPAEREEALTALRRVEEQNEERIRQRRERRERRGNGHDRREGRDRGCDKDTDKEPDPQPS